MTTKQLFEKRVSIDDLRLANEVRRWTEQTSVPPMPLNQPPASTMDAQKTMVIFRKYKPSRHDDGDVIALFPCQKPNGYMLSYEHIGQHEAVDYPHALSITRKATPAEAIDLADELKVLGYKLSTRQRRPSEAYAKKWLEMGNL